MQRKLVGDIMGNEEKNYNIDLEYLEEFLQKDGTYYIIPTEIVNELKGQVKDLLEHNKEYRDICRAKTASIEKYALKVSFLEIDRKKTKEKIEQLEQNKKDAIDILNRKVK